MENNILNYLDKQIENIKKKTGNYPEFIELSSQTIEKFKEAIKNYIPKLDGCWAEIELLNYRGILIKEVI